MGNVLENPILPFAVVSMIPAVAWMVSIVGWMISDEVGSLEGSFSIGLVFSLCILAITTTEVMVSMAASFSLLIAGAIYPLVRVHLHRRAHLMIDMDIMRSAYRQLDARSTNVGAKVQLAKICYKRRLIGPALALMKEAVADAPTALQDEKRTIEVWEAMHGRSLSARDIHCPRCSAPNKPSERYCRRCKSALLIGLARGGQLMDGTPLRVFWVWVIAVATLILAPALAIILPRGVAIPSILALLVLSGLLLYRILRPNNR